MITFLFILSYLIVSIMFFYIGAGFIVWAYMETPKDPIKKAMFKNIIDEAKKKNKTKQ